MPELTAEQLPNIDDLFAAEKNPPPADPPAEPVKGKEGGEPPANPKDGDETKPDDDSKSEGEEGSGEGEGEGEGGEPQELTLIEEIAQTLGYEFEDKTYDNSTEGLANYFRDASEKHAEAQLDRIFQDFPLVKALFEYQMDGGDPQAFVQTFFGQTDYNAIEVGEKDYALQERILRDELQSRGYSEAEIAEEIDHAKSTDRLHKTAVRALEVLRKNQKDSKEKLISDQRKAAEDEARERAAQKEKAQKLIKESNSLRGIPLPEKDKIAFDDYLFKAGPDGRTEYQKALESTDMDVELATAYLLFKGFDLSGVVSRKAKSLQAEDLRKRLAKENNQPSASGSQPNKDVQPKSIEATVANIDYDAVFRS